ncbi:MAG TPA: elongation factor P [Candidatus Cloacimonadota bacterium]|nr:elongation factor P [Candidatus Cloacimonadota bacterium]HPT72057.1 elongation factor P [Candidatus Cloacimonadota bacterium]
MATTSDIRNGMIIEFKDGLYQIVDFLHVKPGKGGAFVRTKMKNMKTGQVLENTFRTSETLNEVRVEKTKMEYLYRDGDFFVLMDNVTYEQIHVGKNVMGDREKFLQENMEIGVLSTEAGEIIDIELPTTVIQTIAECEPNVKGNTASGGGKAAFTETGLRIMVPFFVEAGEKVKIDTRSGEYIERA